jgi:hypothetical protein
MRMSGTRWLVFAAAATAAVAAVTVVGVAAAAPLGSTASAKDKRPP